MIIVTGGAGFIGSALVWKLNQMGRNDIIIVDHLGKDDKWKNLVSLDYFEFFERADFGEMVQHGFIEKSKIETVIHLGANSSTTEPDFDNLLRWNYEYSKFLCERSLVAGAKFIYASSAATYGDGSMGYSDDEKTITKLRPLNAYGYSKQMFDLWALKNGYLNRIAGLKYFNVFGPNEYHKGDMRSVVHKAFGQIKETGKIKLFKSYSTEYGDGEQKRDFIYVKDVVDMTLFFHENKIVSGLYNAGTGEANTFNDLVTPVFNALGKYTDIEYIDMPENLSGKYQDYTEADISKLRAAGYTKPITLVNDAVTDYVKNYLDTDYPYLS